MAGADLGPHPVPVVLIDQPERYGSLVDLVGNRLVIGVDVPAGVGLDALEPALRGGSAVGPQVRGDDRLEVGLLGRDGQLPLVLRVSELTDLGGSLPAGISAGL
jgi:hypothetical protein